MNSRYFNNEEYVGYLMKYCNPEVNETVDRVIGINQIIEFLNKMDIKKDAQLLEIGCGIGRVMNIIRKKYTLAVKGCDISENAIKKAKELFPSFKDDFFVSQSDKINFKSESFENIVFWGVFEMTNQKYTLLEISRLLKIGGKALLVAVKNKNFKQDDQSSIQANKAYIEKKFPIYYTDITKFEEILKNLGFSIVNKSIFHYKDDVANFKYIEDKNYQETCSDIYYIIEKSKKTVFDNQIQFFSNGEEYA